MLQGARDTRRSTYNTPDGQLRARLTGACIGPAETGRGAYCICRGLEVQLPFPGGWSTFPSTTSTCFSQLLSALNSYVAGGERGTTARRNRARRVLHLLGGIAFRVQGFGFRVRSAASAACSKFSSRQELAVQSGPYTVQLPSAVHGPPTPGAARTASAAGGLPLQLPSGLIQSRRSRRPSQLVSLNWYITCAELV